MTLTRKTLFLARLMVGASLALGVIAPIVVTSPALAAAAPGPDVPLKLTVLKVQGNQRVATSDIDAALPFHVGDTVTRAQVNDGLQKVLALYQQKNVGARFGEKTTFVGKTIQVLVSVDEQAAGAAPAASALMLDSVSFTGNSRISSADLSAATQMRAGQTVTDQSVAADETAIQALYKKRGIGAQIQPEATYPHHDNHVVLVYKITETAASKDEDRNKDE